MKRLTILLLSLLMVACRPLSPVAGRLGVPTNGGEATAAGTARAVLRIHWPERTVQLIPSTTTAISLSIQPQGATSPSQVQSIPRPASATESVATFEHLSPGPTVFSASAVDGTGKVVAAGSSIVTLLANQLVPVRLVLASTDRPIVTDLAPTNGVPGQQVSLVGSGFGASTGASYSITCAGVPVTGSNLISRVNDSLIAFRVPGVAQPGPVVVTVNGQTATSSKTFTPIASLQLSPGATSSFAPAGLVHFMVAAIDANGGAIANPTVDWTFRITSCDLAGCNMGHLIDDHGTVMVNPDPDETGTAVVQVGQGAVLATASLTVHALAPSDLPVGLGVANAVRVPVDNPQSAAKVALGKALFFDTHLSSTGRMSCSSCHLSNQGFTVAQDLPLGNDGLPLTRNAPTTLDVGRLAGPFFWDGRAATLEDQAIAVFDSARELNISAASVSAYLNASPDYVASFSAVFGQAPDRTLSAKAIASFERTMVTGQSPFERWVSGDATALSDQQKVGLGLFLGKGNCIACHNGPMFTDEQFHNIAIPGSGTTDPGRQRITGLVADAGRFKTPSLRNVALTAPYFHDGSKSTLHDAIQHYEAFDKAFPNVDPQMPKITFSPEDLSALEAFLRAIGGATPSL